MKVVAQPGSPFSLVDRIRYDEIAGDLRRHYETTGERDLKEAETRLRHLDAFFKQYRVVAITPAVITRYIESRQATVARAASKLGGEPERIRKRDHQPRARHAQPHAPLAVS